MLSKPPPKVNMSVWAVGVCVYVCVCVIWVSGFFMFFRQSKNEKLKRQQQCQPLQIHYKATLSQLLYTRPICSTKKKQKWRKRNYGTKCSIYL